MEVDDAMEGRNVAEGEALDFFSLPQLHLPFLTTLDVSNNNWSKVPLNFASLSFLEELSLKGNQITEFPAELCTLRNLHLLDLTHNQLRTLPAEIAQLQKLKTLHLSFNLLEDLPVQITQLRLNFDWNSTPLHALASKDIRPERPDELGKWLRYRAHARWLLTYFVVGLNCGHNSLITLSVSLNDTRFSPKNKL